MTDKPPTGLNCESSHHHPQFTFSNLSSLLALLCLLLKLQLPKVFIKSGFLLDQVPLMPLVVSQKCLIVFFNAIWIFSPPWDLFCLFCLLNPLISIMLNLSIPSSKPRNSVDGVFFQGLYLLITPVTSCPRWKGTLVSLMYWKHIPASFIPHFLFPWLVSIIQAPFLNWNFPCSCILTCWFSLLCSAVFLVWAYSS